MVKAEQEVVLSKHRGFGCETLEVFSGSVHGRVRRSWRRVRFRCADSPILRNFPIEPNLGSNVD